MIWLMLACVVGGDSGTGGAGEVEISVLDMTGAAAVHSQQDHEGHPLVLCCYLDDDGTHCEGGAWDYTVGGTGKLILNVACSNAASRAVDAWAEVRWLP